MYNKLLWKDHFATPSSTFRIQENGDGTITLIPAGEVIQQGTPINAANLNNIEDGILDGHLAQRLLYLANKSQAGTVGELTATSLASIAASLEYQNMMSLDDVDVTEEVQQ